MRGLGEAALAYARRGWLVFPLHGIVNERCTCGRLDCSSPGKHPLVRHGVKEATSDQRVLEEWWSRCRSANIGIATGRASRIVVVDIDPPHGEASLELFGRIGRALPPTLAVRTGSGGRHLYYSTPAWELRNKTARLPGVDRDLPGIDLRGEGGYVVAPPSLHISGRPYEWTDSYGNPAATLHEPYVSLTAVPGWLREPDRQRKPSMGRVRPACDGDGSPYGLAALHDELARLRLAPVGTRNHQLNRAAFCLGQLIACGELDGALARAGLHEAAITCGLERQESARTIASGFEAGMRSPRRALDAKLGDRLDGSVVP